MAKIYKEPDDGCWLWTGWTRGSGDGYGMFSVQFDTEYGRATGLFGAHRVSYVLHIGPIPDGKDLLHSCDRSRCVKPTHLTPGTDIENAADKVRRGRHPRGGRTPGVALPRQPLATRYGERHTFSKLTAAQVVAMREEYAADEHITATSLAKKYGVSKQNVIVILPGKAWKTVGGPLSEIRPITGARVHGAKLTDDKITEIRRRYSPRGINGDSGRTLAKAFGVPFQRISDIVRCNDWKHVP